MRNWREIPVISGFAMVAALAAAAPAGALAQDSADTGEDDAIVVYGRALTQIGEAQSGSQGTVGYADFENRPVSRVGELVENVPGVIATQHSGTGKANQYFLRGFNLDHGIDFAGFVDGVPVNMRTHGHGQGYLDYNFLIPELVERIDYRKGPYFADTGDFAAAGTVRFTTVDSLKAPILDVTAGSHEYWRGMLAGSVGLAGGDLLLGVDGTLSDGPWMLDEDLQKIAGLAKFTTPGGTSFGLTAYRATWDSTDQVPLRAIQGGTIDRYGFIDPDLGGSTTRVGMTVNGEAGNTRWTLFGLHYNMRLTSNFTYFLEDPVDGDEFKQRDRRQVYGGSIAHSGEAAMGSTPVKWTVGGDLRYDRIDKVGLYHSVGGVITSPVREDRVGEFSAAAYANAEFKLSPSLRATLGARADFYSYDVEALSLPANGGDGDDAIFAPKVALAWRAAQSLEFYANYGEGHHSNDVRGASISVDPVSGDPVDPVPVLVRTRGAELGARVETPRVTASLVGFWLDVGSELVFVGDAGTTEPNDASRRFGAEASLFWRPADWLTLDGAAALTHARFRGVAPGEDHIPGAVENVLALGATAEVVHGLSLTARLRHFGAAPLIEDDSVRSAGTTLVNLGAYYRTGPLLLSVDLFNAFDSKDADITYFYASRLPGEPADGVQDLHIHPVEPRQLRVSVRFSL